MSNSSATEIYLEGNSSFNSNTADYHKPYLGLDDDLDEQNNIRILARSLTRKSLNSLSKHPSSSELELKNENLDNNSINNTLTRSLTRMSHVPGQFSLSGPISEIDPRLDPDSENFDSAFWVQNLRKLYENNENYYKPAELGVCLKDLRVSGISNDVDYQTTVLNLPLKTIQNIHSYFFRRNDTTYHFDILKPLHALFEPGRLCVVLGRPGAGCSTLLKTIAARTYGFTIQPESIISYDGIEQHDIIQHYRGDVIYSAEIDHHFATLPVGYTLEFAAKCRCPETRPEGISREDYYKHYAAVIMATYGLSHTYNTKVGNDYIRGVSGGERKRVSIAEVTLAGSKIQCWDNATRGLDSATALEFIKALKVNARVMKITPLIAIYQCSQDAYDLFDDVLLLYEGYEIFFGPAEQAKQYFLDMGWEIPPMQTTADYLTSITAPGERVPRKGFENKVPQTPEEFYHRWMNSKYCADLLSRIDTYLETNKSGKCREILMEHHISRQSKHLRPESPFLISFWMQVKAVMHRNIKRLKGDPSVYLFNIISNTILGLIISSMFYNQKRNTSSFYYRSSALFTAILFNSFSSLLEIMSLYEARNIVEKHKTYAFYHPSADALASIITEIPSKICVALGFNITFYFMINLRRTVGHFFFYFLVSVTSTIAMSHLFRTIGAACTSLPQAMMPAAILLLIISIYVGFIIPKNYIHGWSKWLYYINPIARSMEAMVANEFSGVEYECSQFIPSGGAYDELPLQYKVCSAIGSIPGQTIVSGTRYIELAYGYYYKYRWRNWGIVVCYAAFFLGLYMLLIEYNKGEMQKGEIALFTRSTLKKLKRQHKICKKNDIESNDTERKSADFSDGYSGDDIEKDTLEKIGSEDIFHWRGVCYDVKIKSETRRILNNVDGWVKPGTLTALMGSSGAGKTTLLDVLASRVNTGVITGEMFVNGHARDASFQRSTGYCQQQDLHGRTQTVREALKFSAYLRQPESIPISEKDDYVEKIIHLLEMESYADALVGVTGEGLNVEQRKRLTIGVELVAKPKLLLFLDEPTSGLDSQTAWSICQLMRKLANHGQAVLCTIHQPSAILMQEFDRLLLLAAGGKTIYFGDLGKGCHKMIEYFENHGSEKFPPNCNPAEFMLEVIGAAPGSHASQDYHEVWRNSKEYGDVQNELKWMESELAKKHIENSDDLHKEFATSLWFQYIIVTKRVFEQQWRSPSYIWAKLLMSTFSALFIGFSFFKSNTSIQGLQNQMFSLFVYLMVYNPLIQQMLPQYCDQRDLYEVRERPSKTFSWKAFVLSQVSAELPWCFLIGTISFFCFYYPVGLYQNALDAHQLHERGALFWLLCVAFSIFTITFGQVCMAALELYENAAMLANTCFILCITFCGVLMPKNSMPGFWKFMYYISPFTYLVSSMLATGVGDSTVVCSAEEYVTFPPPDGMTCGQYMDPYIKVASGYVLDPNATKECAFCVMKHTDAYLQTINIKFDEKWRNWGIFVCYSIFNICAFIFLYWMFRVPKKHKIKST